MQPMDTNPHDYMLPAAVLPPEGLIQIDLLFDSPPVKPREPSDKLPRRKAQPGRHGILGIGRSTFYRLVDKGYIAKPVKVGRRRLMTVDQARAAIALISRGIEVVRESETAACN